MVAMALGHMLLRPALWREEARLLSRVLEAEVPLRDFGPWRMAAHLLLEVASGREAVTRPVLHKRMPDGGGIPM